MVALLMTIIARLLHLFPRGLHGLEKSRVPSVAIEVDCFNFSTVYQRLFYLVALFIDRNSHTLVQHEWHTTSLEYGRQLRRH
eukprot:scaffold290885_cov17-Prasinocladus_malaysianus.AAC.1